MTRRSMNASFAPGAYVFPGGGIDAAIAHHPVERRVATEALGNYQELLDELQLRLTVDGPTRVGHGQPFGAFRMAIRDLYLGKVSPDHAHHLVVMLLTALALTFIVFYLTNLPPNLEKLAKTDRSA
mgnify:CR=1 FL=1